MVRKMQEYIIKRNKTQVPFNKEKITMAVYKAMLSIKKGTVVDAESVTDLVIKRLDGLDHIPSVEEVQDIVENELMSYIRTGQDFADVAKTYIFTGNAVGYSGKRKCAWV
ncbi:ATP-cone domain protein [mine drainage metagenome]|uniref:ATP-cone domain protein n=1 Tax=mine drainage metagenome TaxID=410659 RepID=T1A9Q2_9ZZZZ